MRGGFSLTLCQSGIGIKQETLTLPSPLKMERENSSLYTLPPVSMR